MSVKFADIVQSCQVEMIKNLEVVGAFSPKNFFPEKIPPPRRQKNFGQCTILGVQKFFGNTKMFRDIIQIFQISQNNTISHKIDRICPVNFFYKKTISRFSLTFCGILFFVSRQIPSFADNLFSGGCHTPHTPHSRRPWTFCWCITAYLHERQTANGKLKIGFLESTVSCSTLGGFLH